MRLIPLAAFFLGALTLAASAGAHIQPTPTFVTADDVSTVSLTVHNDRKEPMSGLSVRVPSGFRVVDAPRPVIGWEGEVRDDLASWSGCCLESAVAASFSLAIAVPNEPGVVDVVVRQLYPDGEHVEWLVPLTVVPRDEVSGSSWWLLGTVLVALLATQGIVLALMVRRRSLQEK